VIAFCSAYLSILKMDSVHSSETSVTSARLRSVTSQKILLFIYFNIILPSVSERQISRSSWRLPFLFGISRIQISTWEPVILTQVLRGFTQSLLSNADSMPHIRLRILPPISFPVCYSFFILLFDNTGLFFYSLKY
jgi:hypothetical protein